MILNINLKKMFIKNCKNFLINLSMINSNTLIKYIVKCLMIIIILIKLNYSLSFNLSFMKKLIYFLNIFFYLKLKILIN